VGRAPEADPSVEAAVVPRDTAGAAAASSPLDVLPALAPASAEAVVVLAVEPPVAADAEMAEAPLLHASEEGAQNRDPSWGAATSSLRGAVPTGGVSRFGSGPVVLRIPSSSLTMSERSSLGTGFVSVPRHRWGRFSRPWRSFAGTFPRSSSKDFRHIFHVIKAFFVTHASFPQDLTDLSAAKSSFIRREADVWGSLRFLRTTLAEATERLSQRSAEVADLRLLCVDLGAEAAVARAEAQRQQLELGQVISERDQSRGRAAEAESRAEALGDHLAEASAWAGALAADLAVAQATSSKQRARAEVMSWLF
jgi:hypothetical protein